MVNQFQKSASSPSLVACYLVKDEADELRLSLDSVKDFVDDIFIIMTNSKLELELCQKFINPIIEW